MQTPSAVAAVAVALLCAAPATAGARTVCGVRSGTRNGARHRLRVRFDRRGEPLRVLSTRRAAP